MFSDMGVGSVSERGVSESVLYDHWPWPMGQCIRSFIVLTDLFVFIQFVD